MMMGLNGAQFVLYSYKRLTNSTINVEGVQFV